MDVETERLAAELAQRLVGQQAVLGRDVAVGLGGGHVVIQPRERPLPAQPQIGTLSVAVKPLPTDPFIVAIWRE